MADRKLPDILVAIDSTPRLVATAVGDDVEKFLGVVRGKVDRERLSDVAVFRGARLVAAVCRDRDGDAEINYLSPGGKPEG